MGPRPCRLQLYAGDSRLMSQAPTITGWFGRDDILASWTYDPSMALNEYLAEEVALDETPPVSRQVHFLLHVSAVPRNTSLNGDVLQPDLAVLPGLEGAPHFGRVEIVEDQAAPGAQHPIALPDAVRCNLWRQVLQHVR